MLGIVRQTVRTFILAADRNEVATKLVTDAIILAVLCGTADLIGFGVLDVARRTLVRIAHGHLEAANGRTLFLWAKQRLTVTIHCGSVRIANRAIDRRALNSFVATGLGIQRRAVASSARDLRCANEPYLAFRTRHLVAHSAPDSLDSADASKLLNMAPNVLGSALRHTLENCLASPIYYLSRKFL
jgi:hypothetical protein